MRKAAVIWFNEYKGFGQVVLKDGRRALMCGDVLGGDMWGHNIPGGAPKPDDVLTVAIEEYTGRMSGVEWYVTKAKREIKK